MSDALGWIDAPCLPFDAMAADAARRRQDQLTKPRGSLGRLEALAIRLAGLQGSPTPSADPAQILLFAADHGVAAEGVSAFPQSVTAEMVRNIAAGGAAVSVMAASLGARLEVIDLGTRVDPGPIEGVRSERIGPGTGNITRQPAMSPSQLAAALGAGRSALERAVDSGARILIGGEMGIGNSTSASALACALLGCSPQEIVGPGTGLDAEGVARKAMVVATALERHRDAGPAPLDLLARLGGFELAGLVGAFLSAAQHGLPVLIDGFIVSAAALAAVRVKPEVGDWLLFAHRSAEPGHQRLLEALDAEPLLDLGMRLGEGSGAAAALPILRLACTLHQRMATFAEAGVGQS